MITIRSSVLAMKTLMRLPSSIASFLLVGVLYVSASSLQAGTHTLTTNAADGGFDGWQGGYTSGPAGGSSTGSQLRVGNAGPSGDWLNVRAAAVLMFDLSQLQIDFTQEQIVSVELSFRVVTLYGSGPVSLALTHGTKTTETVDYGATQDTPLTGPTNDRWSYIPGVEPVDVLAANTTITFDVTSAFLADLAAGNAYSSYRLVQPESYYTADGGKLGQSWGVIIASAESGNAIIPTLTITTQAIPEPAHAGLIAGGVLFGMALFLRYRRQTSHPRG